MLLVVAVIFSPYLFVPAAWIGICATSWRAALTLDLLLVTVLVFGVFDREPSVGLFAISMIAALFWSGAAFRFRQYLAEDAGERQGSGF